MATSERSDQMSQDYHRGHRELQERFDSRRLADRLAEAASAEISDAHSEFIEARDMFFLSTADAHAAPECSYKGGEPGFVRVVDPRTVVFPVYDGNGMFLSMGNITVNSQVALLFIDFTTGTRLRLNGTASVEFDDPLIETYPGAKFLVRVTATAVFANCRRYVHRYELVDRSPFVPAVSGETLVPDWKLDPWFAGTLPAGDPAGDPDSTVGESIPQF